MDGLFDKRFETKLNKFESIIQDKFSSITIGTKRDPCKIDPYESSNKESTQEEKKKKLFVPKLFKRNSSVMKNNVKIANKYQLRKRVELSCDQEKSSHQMCKNVKVSNTLAKNLKTKNEPESSPIEATSNLRYDCKDELYMTRNDLFTQRKKSELSVIWHSTQSDENFDSNEIDTDDNDSDLLIL